MIILAETHKGLNSTPYEFLILVNRFDYNITSGNIISDVSDHYSQFCILHSVKEQTSKQKTKNRDFSNFPENDFIAELAHTNRDWDCIVQNNTDRSFSTFYNKLNKILKKHAPMKTPSRMELPSTWNTQTLENCF